jgi:hypothetical protein
MLYGLFIPGSSCIDNYLALLHFSLWVSSLLLLEAMEDKRGTKHSHSPSMEGSSPPSRASTPPSASSGSPPSLQSLPEVSSHRHCSLIFEQGSPPGKALVVDLSSSSTRKVSSLILHVMRSSP